MAARARAALKTARRPLVYTAQDMARFCEVDLKTIHHWADAGKIPHRRTEGRHLRFRRNHVLAFLRAHGYPLPALLVQEKPTVFLATLDPSADEPARKLALRCFVRRFDCAIAAIARLLSDEPDALVILDSDATWTPATSTTIGGDPETSWVRIVVTSDLSRLHLELPRWLDVE